MSPPVLSPDRLAFELGRLLLRALMAEAAAEQAETRARELDALLDGAAHEPQRATVSD